MKTIILSDTHLTTSFDERKFKVLKSVIEEGDKIIINGDFWDGFFCTFEQFTNSKWNQLFPLLKSRNTIYLYGNHDTNEMMNDKIEDFSNKQTKSTFLDTQDKQLVITHGHNIINNPRSNLVSIIGDMCANIVGPSFYRISSYANVRMKTFAKSHMNDHRILVSGHSHLFEFSPKESFINLGVINHGWAQYVIVDNGKITSVNEKYR